MTTDSMTIEKPPSRYKPSPSMWALSALCGITLFGGISRFGIWDPWELEIAEQARSWLPRGGALFSNPNGAGFVALSFQWLGVQEWTGRLPGAVMGVATLLCTLNLALRAIGRASAPIAGIVLLSTPAFLLNTIPMGGYGAGILLQTVIACAGILALDPIASQQTRWLALGVSAVAAAAAIAVHGAMLGAMPPLLALGSAAIWKLCAQVRNQEHTQVRSFLPEALMASGTALLCTCVILGIFEDHPAYALWTGGPPTHHNAPAFDLVLERTFHGLGPWAALVPFALAYPFSLRALTGAQQRAAFIAAVCSLWCLAGYGAQTLFLARYGADATFLPVAGIAVLCALLLSTDSLKPVSPGLLTISVALLLGLQIRDYALVPESPLQALPIGKFSVPGVFNPKLAWAGLLGAFGVTLILTMRRDNSAGLRQTITHPYRTLVGVWNASWVGRSWLGLAAVLSLGLLTASGLAWLSPTSMNLSSLGEKALRLLGPAILAAPPFVACATLLWWIFGALGQRRRVPLLASACAISLYTVHGFLPGLSAHLSPREVYETFNDLADEGQELAEFKVGGTAAGYYVSGSVKHVVTVAALVDYLLEDAPRWAALRAKDLGQVDSQYRGKTGKHLVVADAQSARIILVTNRTLTDLTDHNALSDVVLNSPPDRIQHPTRARFGDQLELLGYDIESNIPGSVGAGETFNFVWYYRVLGTQRTEYKVFVHLDGQGARIHGDHQATGGLYAMPLWSKGDIIVDRHEVSIPATAKLGDYQILSGFYKGDKRLPVKEGPKDDADRVKAGRLRIQ